MARVVRPRVDYDPAHGEKPRCWVCYQAWPFPLSIVFDAENRELRIDGADPVAVRGALCDVLSVLINAHPRWVTRAQVVEHAYAERPDVDMPSPTVANSHVAGIRKLLDGSRYRIETDQHRGWRLVTQEYVEQERREYLAQIPGAEGRKMDNIAAISKGALPKTPGALPKPIRISTGIGSKSKLHPEGRTKKSRNGKPTPKLTKGHQYSKKGRSPHVRPH